MAKRCRPFRCIFLIESIILITWASLASGQVTKRASGCTRTFDTLTNKDVYNFVETPAKVSGGWDQLYSELRQIKIPKNFETDQISILISFIVESNGEINGLRTNLNGTTLHNELLKCLRKFKWKPGECKGIKVPTKLVLSIKS